MKTWAQDLTGKRFNRWVVINFDHLKKGYNRFWKCKCDCGKEKIVSGYSLLYNNSKSCGCFNSEIASINGKKRKTHGMSESGVYESWYDMINRCQNPIRGAFIDYGGRGIKICKRWSSSFENFYKDMGERPTGKTLDRINNNLNYSCGKCEECIKNVWSFNCQWATKKEQMRNTRKNVNIEYKGQIKCISEWAEEYKIPYQLVWNRLFRRFWMIEEALTTPIIKKGYTLKPIERGTIIEFEGKRQNVTNWAKEIGINKQTLFNRLENWSLEEALTTPALK